MAEKNEVSQKKIVWLVAGGTGGHISPAVAIAQKMRNGASKKTSQEEILFPVIVTLPKNLSYSDLATFSREGGELFACDAPMIPHSPFSFLMFPWKMARALLALFTLYKRHRPDLVLAFGGYPSFPALFFARLFGISYALHEQNQAEGVVTRLMKSHAKRIYTSFPDVSSEPKVRFLGNPLRNSFAKLPPKRKKIKAVQTILFLGGSQGASDINALFEAMSRDQRFEHIRFIISTGRRDFEKIRSIARPKDRIEAFIEEMPKVLLEADLAVARAGSATLYEILWAKVPTVFLPYPYAKDDHQRKNADTLAKEGLALICDHRPFDSAVAVEEIYEALKSGKIAEISQNLSNHHFPLDDGETICQDIRQLCKTL